MKKLFNRITEKQARVLTLCLLGAAAVLLGAALSLAGIVVLKRKTL